MMRRTCATGLVSEAGPVKDIVSLVDLDLGIRVYLRASRQLHLGAVRLR